MGMWWEIVPVFGICVGLAWAPVWLTSAVHKIAFGTMFKRNLDTSHSWYLYQRDRDHAPSHILSRRYYNKGSGVGEGFVYKTYGLEKYED